MKRAELLLEQVADPDNLRLAAWKAAKGKRYADEVLTWFSRMEKQVPLQKSKQRFLRKMQIVDENYHSGEWSEAKCQRRALPLLAFARHADTEALRKNLLLRLNGQSS